MDRRSYVLYVSIYTRSTCHYMLGSTVCFSRILILCFYVLCVDIQITNPFSSINGQPDGLFLLHLLQDMKHCWLDDVMPLAWKFSLLIKFFSCRILLYFYWNIFEISETRFSFPFIIILSFESWLFQLNISDWCFSSNSELDSIYLSFLIFSFTYYFAKYDVTFEIWICCAKTFFFLTLLKVISWDEEDSSVRLSGFDFKYSNFKISLK